MTTTFPVDLRERCAELFCADLAPMLRRLGARDKGAGAGAVLHPDDAATREGVWAALADLGAFGDQRQRDLVDLAELAGWALYQSPLTDSWFAAELLTATGDPAYAPILRDLAGGATALAVAMRERPGDEPTEPGPLHRHEDGTVDATRSVVAFAPDAGHLLLVGTDGGRTLLAVVPATGPGVTLRRHDDIARGDLYTVTVTHGEIVGAVHDITDQYPAALAGARIRHAAYLAGSARGAIEVAAQRLRERTAFGQPLARMQALAYRFAALAARTAAVLSSVRAGALAADEGADVRLTGAQVLLLAGVLAQEAAAECVHVHGAHGMTEAGDAQLFYRRAVVDAAWLGRTPSLRREAGRLLAHTRFPPR
ncbi:acyl-CoA dehydrogenase family protein [Winogradskya humida]|uniref:Acyl-CoA dehydrogenase/oxidase C-terminal domain-containing protein n=1 Tax=Winogradskya humida TaxID=113566 RepID=A0ABQ4A3T1_9ACTN|nr:acyl-CoA dehydrogenase family protein [Actinoplanes humidus]GIE25012.1 hypothetical protein Ahu01nite_081140 [Actinoplanes humidus]